MARGANAVHLIGHLTTDGKKLDTKQAFCSRFSIAVDRRFKRGDKWETETCFISCVYWNSQNVFDYLKQGRQVYVEGHLISWIAKDEQSGRQNTVLEVSVDELLLTDNKPKDGGGGSNPDADYAKNLERYEDQLHGQSEQLARDREALDRDRQLLEQERKLLLQQHQEATSGRVHPIDRPATGQKRAPAKRKGGRG